MVGKKGGLRPSGRHKSQKKRRKENYLLNYLLGRSALYA
jgi:hypothetical protein